jgi:hypothetical protein
LNFLIDLICDSGIVESKETQEFYGYTDVSEYGVHNLRCVLRDSNKTRWIIGTNLLVEETSALRVETIALPITKGAMIV